MRREHLIAAPRTTEPTGGSGVGHVSMDRMGKALGDKIRWRILQELGQAGTLTCTQVLERFHLSQPSISRHLKVLVDAGLVSMRADGAHHYFALRHEVLGHMRQAIEGLEGRQVRAKGQGSGLVTRSTKHQVNIRRR